MIDLDTTVNEPPMKASEAQMLLFALERSRAQLAWKCGGLDAAGLRHAHPPSTMTLGGLLKHLAFVEAYYTARDLTGGPPVGPWRQEDFDADPDYCWHSAADDSPEELYTLWRDAADRREAAVREALEEGGPDQPTRHVWPEGGQRNLRRLLVDLHDEYARHVGHADLLREAVDGLVGEDPPR